jgi:hypothetical protein
MQTKTFIFIRFQIEGFHNFPGAKELFPEVGFLADRHRHIFHIECKKEVFHDDRDVEFIMFKREIQSYVIDKFGANYRDDSPPFHYHCEFGGMSCEMIAKDLLEHFELESCSVLEDGENGAEVRRA